MKIPKTYHGIPVVVSNKRAKHELHATAEAYLNRAKKPVIKVWKDKPVNSWDLNHELGHIKLGHVKKNRTVYNNMKYEVEAERYASRMAGKKGKIPPKRLTYLTGTMIITVGKKTREDMRKNWDEYRQPLIKWGKDSGLTKKESEKGIDGIYAKNKSKLRK